MPGKVLHILKKKAQFFFRQHLGVKTIVARLVQAPPPTNQPLRKSVMDMPPSLLKHQLSE